jgi:protein-tyrosine kinase
MENIRQALQRARELSQTSVVQKEHFVSSSPPPPFEPDNAGADSTAPESQRIALALAHLESNRIISYDDVDPRSRSFDMLRTQVLQSMDQKNWKVLGITSPTPSCGKTLTAINLAFSITRQARRQVLLIDLDLQKPQIASCLGINCEAGLISVLDGRSNLTSAVISARAGDREIKVLPTEAPVSDSSVRMSSRALSAMLQEIRQNYRNHIIVVDLPPMLLSDDVIAIMPKLDCMLLVAAVGRSRVSEIEECQKHLQSAEVIRVVLNKVPQLNAQYYNYAYYGRP